MPLPFSTIDKGVYWTLLPDRTELYYSFPVRFPQLVIIDDPRDLEFLVVRNRGGRDRYYISQDAFTRVGRTDFEKNLVLVAFAGDFLEFGTTIQIGGVWHGPGAAAYLALFIDEPRDKTGRRVMGTSYHAVELRREHFSPGVEYDLLGVSVDGKEIARTRGVVRWPAGAKPLPVAFEFVASGGMQPAGRFLTKPELIVVTSQESAQEAIRQNPGFPGFGRGAQEALLNTDYETHLVVVALLPFSVVGPFLYINKTDRIGDVLRIKGIFTDPSTTIPAPGAPYSMIRIRKQELSRRGTLTFSLVDHAGFERARTVASVP